eukprot:COSAG01_NODE_21219_length_912_cov_1.761378_1_plen_166_part_00
MKKCDGRDWLVARPSPRRRPGGERLPRRCPDNAPMIRLRHLTACFASAATPHGSLARAATTTATTSFSFSTSSAGTMAAAAAAAVAAAPSQGELKKQVGYKAVDDFVRSGMKIGLGTGSTAYFAVERVGQLLASGELTDIIAVRPCLRRFCLPGPALPFSACWTR